MHIIRAIVQAETGGNITIRNVWTSDLVDKPLKNDNPVDGVDPIIEPDFTIDIDRLNQLISSLNYIDLSYQNDIWLPDTYDRIFV